jgi:hypothetical protein
VTEDPVKSNIARKKATHRTIEALIELVSKPPSAHFGNGMYELAKVGLVMCSIQFADPGIKHKGTSAISQAKIPAKSGEPLV